MNIGSVLGTVAVRLPKNPTSLSPCPPEAFNQEVERNPSKQMIKFRGGEVTVDAAVSGEE